MSGSEPQPGPSSPLDPVWTLALARAVSAAVELERGEGEVVADLVERITARLPGRRVALLTARPGQLRLTAAEASGEWQGGRPDRLELAPKEAVAAGLAADAYVAVVTPRPLVRGCAVSARAPLSGPDLAGLLTVEREHLASAEELEEDRQIARLLAAAVSTALSAHRQHGDLHGRQRLARLALYQEETLLLGVDEGGRIQLFNRALERLTGFQEEEMRGVAVEQWLGQGEGTVLASLVRGALGGRPTRGVEARLPLRTGGRVVVVLSTTPLLDEHLRLVGAAAVGIPRRELAALSARFESRAVRQSLLARGVVERLVAPVEALGALPLEGAPAGCAEGVARVTAGLRELRAAMALLTGAPGPGRSVLALNAAIEEALRGCSDLLARSGARVRTAFAGELPELTGDPERLALALRHLLANACEALPPGGGRVTVRTWDNRDGTVGLSVADDGRGIPEADLPQLFRPFFTAGGGPERLGLGLAVVQDVVDEHDGSIDVDSIEGEGTVVTVTLPVRSEHTPEDSRG